jgi:DNA-binding CsgD family transcriptional regulator
MPKFSHHKRMQALVSILEAADGCLSPEQALERIADVIVQCYPGSRVTIVLKRDDGIYHLLAQRNFFVSDADLEKIINDDSLFMRPHESMKHPVFIDDYTKEARENSGNYTERRLAYLPLLSHGRILGWFTLSSADAIGWMPEDEAWLPLVGRQCGVIVNQIRTAFEMNERKKLARDLHQAISDILDKEHTEMPGQAKTGDDVRLWSERLSKLTPREHEVLLEIAEGATNAEIASELMISDGTARKHTENILAKLNLKNRVQVAIAVQKLGA